MNELIQGVFGLTRGIDIFGLEITFYAICILIGMFGAYFYGMHIARKIGVKENDLFDGFVMGVIIGIIGTRLYYVAFTWADFKDNPITIITGIREGGLAIHGGIIAALIFIIIYVRVRKMSFYKVIEIVAPGFLIGQTAGRWGNFFNQEAHGGPVTRAFLESLNIPEFITNNMYFYSNTVGFTSYFHPTFLYESIWNLLGLIALISLRKVWKRYWIGDAGIFYLMWYSTGRFFIEGLRTDALMSTYFGIEMMQAQVISIVMFLTGILLLLLRRFKNLYPVSFMDELEKNAA